MTRHRPASLHAARAALATCVMAMSAGCATHRAFNPYHDLGAGLTASTVRGTRFDHVVVQPRGQTSAPTLWVFLEGDGQPWVDNGRRIARDPSPRIPLAFDLFEDSDVARAYLGRPCYFGHANDAGCDQSLWTSARYGEDVVASLAAALETLVRDNTARRVILVGYSGGGPLAYLLAPRVAAVVAVVTLSGNLDIDAWTQAHGFLALSASGNPATMPALDRRITQIAILGGRDANVPRGTLRAFLARQQPQEVWTYEQADHACCWRREWPSILHRLRDRLERAPVARVEASAAVAAERAH